MVNVSAPTIDVIMVIAPMSIAGSTDSVFERTVKMFVFVDLDLKVIKKELLLVLISTNVAKKHIVAISGRNAKIPLEVISVNVVKAGAVMVIRHVAKEQMTNVFIAVTVVLLVNVKLMT